MTSASAHDLKVMRSRYKRLRAAGKCHSCGKKAAKGQAMCKRCGKTKADWHVRNRERSNQNSRDRYRRLWDTVLNGYGRKCTCCSESRIEFLTIDHIKGGGRKHREKFNGAMSLFLMWIIKHKFPKTLRILCMNCNLSYGLYGYCPHQEEALEKYGAELEPEDPSKTASVGETCPRCGTKVTGPHCPNCGTEPFEKRPPMKKQPGENEDDRRT